MSRLIGALCAMALAAAAAPAHAASFDCKAAASPIEHLICEDPDLNSYDSQMQGAYAGALDRSLHRQQLTETQRAWMKARDACADVTCMSRAYQARIAELAKVSDAPAICDGSSTPEVDACEAEYTRRADRELERYVAAARRRIASDAAYDGRPGESGKTLAELAASQTAWEAYRKAECDAAYQSWIEGTIRGAKYEGCMQTVTRARTQEVWDLWLQYMDSTPPLLPEPKGSGR